MAAYARHDYQSLADSVDFGVHDAILGHGRRYRRPDLRAVARFPRAYGNRNGPAGGGRGGRSPLGRCRPLPFVPGDLFRKWPVRSDAAVLARVLHDWSDDDAVRILARAREAMSEGARFTWWRWWLTNHPAPAVCWT